MSKRTTRQRKAFGYNGGGTGRAHDEQPGLRVPNHAGAEQGPSSSLTLFVDAAHASDTEPSEINLVQSDVTPGRRRSKRIRTRKSMDVTTALAGQSPTPRKLRNRPAASACHAPPPALIWPPINQPVYYPQLLPAHEAAVLPPNHVLPIQLQHALHHHHHMDNGPPNPFQPVFPHQEVALFDPGLMQ